MTSIEEIYFDDICVVKATGSQFRVNQVDRDAETVADMSGNWYDVEELELK